MAVILGVSLRPPRRAEVVDALFWPAASYVPVSIMFIGTHVPEALAASAGLCAGYAVVALERAAGFRLSAAPAQTLIANALTAAPVGALVTLMLAPVLP